MFHYKCELSNSCAFKFVAKMFIYVDYMLQKNLYLIQEDWLLKSIKIKICSSISYSVLSVLAIYQVSDDKHCMCRTKVWTSKAACF